MERLTFFLSAAALCVFLTVAFGSAMTTDCLCDGLPGSQCDYCAAEEQAEEIDMAAPGVQGEYYKAWEEEHRELHEQWVLAHEEFHAVPRTEQEDRVFHADMEQAHREFHGFVTGTLEDKAVLPATGSGR